MKRHVMVRSAALGTALFVMLAWTVGACAGDDADSGSRGAGADDGDVEAYCDRVAGFGDEVPTQLEFERLVALAPSAITDEVRLVADSFYDDEATSDEIDDALGAIDEIEAFEAENCGTFEDQGTPTSAA